MTLVLDTNFIETMLYIIGFCVIFYITFLILNASRLEEAFKRGKVWQIRMAYFFICIVVSHIIMSAILYLTNYFLSI